MDWWLVETSFWAAPVLVKNGNVVRAAPIIHERYIGQSLWHLCRALTATASPLLSVSEGEIATAVAWRKP